MEERTAKANLKRIVIIGPESTGKTTLSKQLAHEYQTVWIPEYARTYVEQLGRPYHYEDVLHIAEKQVDLDVHYESLAKGFLFLDTDLIITKIWLLWIYNECPAWIDHYLSEKKTDLYLLCNTDIPWVPDPVRENPGEMREKLFKTYKREIENLGYPCRIVSGTGENRFKSAMDALKDLNLLHP